MKHVFRSGIDYLQHLREIVETMFDIFVQASIQYYVQANIAHVRVKDSNSRVCATVQLTHKVMDKTYSDIPLKRNHPCEHRTGFMM